MSASDPTTLPGCLLCGTPQVPKAHACSDFSPGRPLYGAPQNTSTLAGPSSNCPARAPAPWNAMGQPNLHPIQFQLSCQDMFCGEPRDHILALVVLPRCPLHGMPQDLPSCPPSQLQLPFKSPSVWRIQEHPQFISIFASAVFPRYPPCVEPRVPLACTHFSFNHPARVPSV